VPLQHFLTQNKTQPALLSTPKKSPSQPDNSQSFLFNKEGAMWQPNPQVMGQLQHVLQLAK
jgi:hypothetical protein